MKRKNHDVDNLIMQAYVVAVRLKYFIAIMSCFPFNTLVC